MCHCWTKQDKEETKELFNDSKKIFYGLKLDRHFLKNFSCSADIYSTYGPRNCVSTNKAFRISKENKNLIDHVKDQYSSYTNMILTVHWSLLWLYITNWKNRYNYSRTITALLIIYDDRMYFVRFVFNNEVATVNEINGSFDEKWLNIYLNQTLAEFWTIPNTCFGKTNVIQ